MFRHGVMRVETDPAVIRRTVMDGRFELVDGWDVPDCLIVEDIGAEGYCVIHWYESTEGAGMLLARYTDEDDDEPDSGSAEWWARRYIARLTTDAVITGQESRMYALEILTMLCREVA